MSGQKSNWRKQMAKNKNFDLILEANKINYSLRSTFFYRKLNDTGYFTILKNIDKLVKQSKNYSWEDKKFWNITHNAWDLIEKQKIDFLRVFSHPKVLVEHPNLISYYRNVAAIPLKGVQYLAFNITDYESGKKYDISCQNAMRLSKLFNTHISAIVESTLKISINNINSLMFSSAGATIDGSWRNKIGEEAEKMVKSYILRACLNANSIFAMIDKNNNPVDYDKSYDYMANIDLFKGIKLKNKKSILFFSEPDISIIDKTGKPLSVIEVKGETDPAGALERLGAVKKSFDYARRENRNVETILVVSCITDEMGNRLKKDKLIGLVFNLTSIIIDMEYRDNFVHKVNEIINM
jgi:hypothetical protein